MKTICLAQPAKTLNQKENYDSTTQNAPALPSFELPAQRARPVAMPLSRIIAAILFAALLSPFAARAAATFTVSVSPNPATSTTKPTFSATITSGSYIGTVTFKVFGATLSGSTTTFNGNFATYTSDSPFGASPTPYSVTAVLDGDGTPSSNTVSFRVNPVVTIASNTNPSFAGKNVTFTASISSETSGQPTGKLDIFVDGASTSSGAGVAVNGGTSTTFSTTTLSAADHTVEARYTNGNYGNLTSTLTQKSYAKFAVTLPATAMTGDTVPLTVTAQNASNQTVTSYNATSTGFTLTRQGPTTVQIGTFPYTFSNGVFTGTVVFQAGSNAAGTYTITAADTPGATGISNNCVVSAVPAGPATKLAFLQQPTNVAVSTAIAPAVTVQIQDASGNVTTSTANVTLTFGTNPSAGTLGGTTTVAAVNGTATFSNLTVSAAGTGYTLSAASTSLTSATSTAFNVTAPAAVPTKLAFLQQPTNVAVNAAIAPAVTVQIQDATGAVVTSSTANVTLAFGTNPSTATLGGTTTVAAVAGIATFSNLTVSTAGTGFTLSAASTNLTSATSTAFNVTGGTPAASVDLNVAVAGTTTVVAGSGTANIVYTITVTNNGPAAASGITVGNTLTIPAGVTAIGGAPSVGTFNAANGVWTLGALANGANATLGIALTAGSTAAAGTNTVRETATILTCDQTLTNVADDTGTTATSIAAVGTSASQSLIYALGDSGANNQIFGYSLNETTGALTALTGFPVDSGGVAGGGRLPEHLAIDRNNLRLFVLNVNGKSLSVFSINGTTGALTALPYSPIALGTPIVNWVTMQVHPSGSPVIVGDAGGQIASINITATAAVAASGSPFTTGAATPNSSVFSADGSFLYASGFGSSPSIAEFSVNATTGVLTPLAGSPFSSGVAGPLALTTDSMGRLFAANTATTNVRVFSTTAGVLSAATGNPFNGSGTNPSAGVINPNGYYHICDSVTNSVTGFKISGAGAATTLGSVIGPNNVGSSGPSGIAINTAGTFLFVTNSASRNISVLPVSTSGGVGAGVVQPVGTLGTTSATGIVYQAPVSVDLAVTVTGPPSVAPGSGAGNLVYKVSVKNIGTIAASGVVIANTQTLPAGVTLDSGSTSTGMFISAAGVWVVGNLAAGATATLTLTNTVSSAAISGTVVANAASVARADQTLINTTDDTATASTMIGTAASLVAMATPSTAGTGQSITFSIASTGTAFSWNFGDGSAAGTGASVTHIYTSAGTYTATVTITSAGNVMTTSSVSVTVRAPLFGFGPDTDGDGFSDVFELSQLTNPSDATSTPSGVKSIVGNPPGELLIDRLLLKFNLAKSGGDMLMFGGILTVPTGFVAANKKVFVDIGGVARVFTLNSKGTSLKNGSDTLKITIKNSRGTVFAQNARFLATFKKGTYQTTLNTYGVTNSTAINKPITIPFTVLFNDAVQQNNLELIYNATSNKKGTAK